MEDFFKKADTDTVFWFLTVLIICLTGIAGHDLWTPDEPRVAAISLEMSHTGDVVVPHLAGTPFVEKPPLYFAFSAVMIKMLGPVFGNTTAIRFGSAFLGIGVLFLTFLISRNLWDTRTGVLSAIFLGSMEGFVENSHWIRVDAALAFFVAGTVFCLIKVFHEDRSAYAPLAGICIGGSFLSKGLIGPVLVGIPWFALFVDRFVMIIREKNRVTPFLLKNLLILLFFMALCSLWIIPFYTLGGKALWHEWFWVNHVQRLTGEAVAKGHVMSGRPFYYIKYILVYGLPWAPLIFVWFFTTVVLAIKNRQISRNSIFLMTWGLLSMIILTLSATKRPIYLTPVLPAYAIMAALAMPKKDARWFNAYGFFWMILCTSLVAVVTFCPAFAEFLPREIPPKMLEALTIFNTYHIMSFLGLCTCLLLLTRYRHALKIESRILIVTGIFYLCLFGAPMKAIDTDKGMKSDIIHFTESIPDTEKTNLAGYDLSETFLGCLYYYSGLKVTQLTDSEKVSDILLGRDKEYGYVLLNRTRKTGKEDETLASEPYRIVNRIMTGTDHILYLVKGAKCTKTLAKE